MSKLIARDIRYLAAIAATPRNQIPPRYLVHYCPECGTDKPDPRFHTMLNLRDPNSYLSEKDDIVAIGCEGYHVINPAVIMGMDDSNWDDWTEYLGEEPFRIPVDGN